MVDDLKKRIAEDFGLNALESSEQERMIEKVGTLLFESVIERSIEEMGDAETAEFDLILNDVGEDYEKVLGFLKEKVPNFGNIVAEELTRLKTVSTGLFG